jgi:hypothetical protein
LEQTHVAADINTQTKGGGIMASTTSRMTSKKTSTTGRNSTIRKAEELLVITRNAEGMFARVTGPLARNNINIECYTSYAWGNEAAFRLVTNNNRKARDLLRSEGYSVQEMPVVLWSTTNEPGWLTKAATALANAHINTFSSYATALPNSTETIVTFNTSDTNRTIEVLGNLR